MAKENLDKDVVVIGAGAAGLSTLLWCAELGLDAVVFEAASEPGGQLLRIYNPVTNYLGLSTRNGRDLRDHFLARLGDLSARFEVDSAVEEIDSATGLVRLAEGTELVTRCIVLATGVSRRRLNVPGEAEFAGKGILTSGAGQKQIVKEKRVAIIGGGDAAIENALILADFADSVVVIHRRDRVTAREEFRERARSNPKIEFLLEAEVERIEGGETVEAVAVRTSAGNIRVEADAVLIRIGVAPNSQLLAGQVELDSGGYVVADSACRTSRIGVFAVGDVANPIAPTISTAAGMGATAAKAVYALLNSRIRL